MYFGCGDPATGRVRICTRDDGKEDGARQLQWTSTASDQTSNVGVVLREVSPESCH
jgi:hypothetical protein